VCIIFDPSGGELTGDTEGEDSVVLRDNDIIITTPEKWDAITRKTKDYARLVDLIRLLLVKNHSKLKLIVRLMKFIS
jgi:ATP-dependent DNA helicase HFM1/MER3